MLASKQNNVMAGDGCCDPSTTPNTGSDVPGTPLEEVWPRGPELSTPSEIVEQAVQSAVERAIFGRNELARRRFFQLVGASTATAIIHSVFPLDTANPWLRNRSRASKRRT